MNPLNRIARRLAGTLGLASILLGLSAAPALAAPSLQVELTRQASEVQAVFVKATGGQFRLSFGSGGPGVSETGDLPFNASGAAVEAALNGLANVNAGGGSVLVSSFQPQVFKVEFTGGALANTDVPLLSASDGTTPLSGGGSRVVTRTLYEAEVSRSDEMLKYTTSVKNTASSALSAGETLTCHPGSWTGNGSPAFAYRWLRNGVAIPGATNPTYATLAPADEGASIQCQVTATNTLADVTNAADFTGSTRISAALVPNPQPASTPPVLSSSLGAPSASGELDATASRTLTCNAGSWNNAPVSYLYQWYRNGVAIGAPVGPTASTSAPLTLSAAEQSPPAAFQCAVTATNAGGSVSKVSDLRTTAAALTPNPVVPDTSSSNPLVTKPNDAIGPLSLEVELPGGLETSVFSVKGSGWSCTTAAAVGVTPAKATCARADVLAAGATYPVLNIVAELGDDAPDHAIANATVSGGGAAGAATEGDEFDFTPTKPFAFEAFDSEVIGADGNDYTQAGAHPFSAGISFQAPSFRGEAFGEAFIPRSPVENLRKTIVDLARGLVANPLSVPALCPGVEDVIASSCPAGSAVGLINLDVEIGESIFSTIKMPIFSIAPEEGLPAQFAFAELANVGTPFTLSPRLRADDGYAISLDVSSAPLSPGLRRLHEGLFCGFGAKVTGNNFEGCREPTDPLSNPVPLVTNPTRCSGTPPTTKISLDSWQHPGVFISAEVSDPQNTGCENVDFQPEVSITPTNKQAETPTGVDVEITMPTDGLESPTGLAQSNLDNAVVTFPKGMSLNPAAAHGLGSCTPAQVGLGNNNDDQCPLSSQIGTIEIDTPLIRETLKGHVFLASQKDNPFKSTLGIYLVFASKKDGVTIKVAGKLEPDPVTGQLTSSFVENPEAPFSRLAIKFNSGPRAPLINPPKCGTYAIHSEMSPWSAASPANPTPAEIASADSVYEVTSGPNGSPCPDGALDPSFQAGLKNTVAGSKSPFVLKLSREDGSDRFTGLGLSMPKGFTAYLKGVTSCPEHVLGSISPAELAGRGEQATPACPASSKVGTVQAGAGAGPYPFYAQGRVFLAGPYKGAPLSFVAVTPAVAGPFDFGNVVVRNAVYVDPASAQVSIVSDPIPTIVHGILLDIKDLRVSIDRSNFTAAPTNCEASSIAGRISGESGAGVTRQNRFQVGDCASLGFAPKLDLRLFGGTKRGAHPRLVAKLTARPGDANIAGASVALPHSEFLDQAHIRTVCTRVQFRANACPAGAIYGHAEAVTPLLDNPLSGPVYLRSSDNPLPDLVMKLRGPDSQPIEVVLAGRVDSVHGGIRSSFEAIPDQPVSSFTLNMQGGKKGLLVNSRDICKSVNKATARFTGQNGKTSDSRPVLVNSCGKAAKKKAKQAKKQAKHKRHSGR